MLKKLKPWHWIAIGIGAIILYNWYMKKKNSSAGLMTSKPRTGSEEIPSSERGSGDRSTELYKQSVMRTIPLDGTELYVA